MVDLTFLTPAKRRRIAAGLLGALVFLVSWFFRFNNPEGSFAGLTDDHFFYLIRGWQILDGDLPVRDFVDQGAPAYYYVAAAVQILFGRGTLSEFTFSVTLIAVTATLTFWLCLRVSRSLLLALSGAAFQIVLSPRMYNYPKVLSYAIAIPLLWLFAEQPRARPRFWVAMVTVLAFLFRHDHGVFIAVGFVALLLVHGQLTWRDRFRHGLLYAATVLLLLGPYLTFVQANGGILSYFRQVSAWAARDRERAPVIWPGLFDYPDGRTADASAWLPARAVDAVRDNAVAYLYYVELALPVFAAAVLLLSRDAFLPRWPRAVPKLAVVAVLGAVLDAGFLRSPLAARFADPSVPLAILIAWLGVALPGLWRSPGSWRPMLERWRRPLGGALIVAGGLLAVVLGIAMTVNLYDRVDGAAMMDDVSKPMKQAGHIVDRLRSEWNLSAWVDRPDRPDLTTLAMYLEACTPPDARVFVQPYMPQVLGLSRRAFAGGHADLRPGFFNAPDAQRLTIARLGRQDVPVALLETDAGNRNFRKSFPLVTAYLDEHYDAVATHLFDGRFGVQLLARKELRSTQRFALLDWPCYH